MCLSLLFLRFLWCLVTLDWPYSKWHEKHWCNSLYRPMLHFHLFPCMYCDALFIFPCFLGFGFFALSWFFISLYMHFKILYCAVCPALLLLPEHFCNTETDVQTPNCSHKIFQGLITQDRIFVEFDILYRQTEKHIWHNRSRTSGCDQVSSEVSMSLPMYILLDCLFWYIIIPSQCYHNIKTTSFKPFFLNQLLLGLRGTTVDFEVEKNYYTKESHVLEELRSKVRVYLFTCMQAKCDNLWDLVLCRWIILSVRLWNWSSPFTAR